MRVKNAKSLEGIPWDEMLYYDETSPSCLRHKNDKVRPNNLSVARKAGEVACSINSSTGYWRYLSSRYGDFAGHRIVWFLITGEDVPPDCLVDHIDGDRLNNKIDNLRLVSETVNLRNAVKYSNNTTGITGIYYDKKSGDNFYWKASWMDLDGKQKTKSFSVKKHGFDIAKELAVQYRTEVIQQLNEQGAGYTDRHGT